MKRLLACAAALICLLTLSELSGRATQENKPVTGGVRAARTFDAKKRELISTALPAVRIKFGKDFKYIGGQSFILYDVANAEQHFFVDADKEGRIRRLYWVQFEGYLPGNNHTYNYKSDKTANLGGYEFIADSLARTVEAAKAEQRPDSDGARARAFLENKGYRMASNELLWQRLVHMVDAGKRNELMIIYLEDLGGSGLLAEDFAKNGKAERMWKDVAEGLLRRAVSGIEIRGN